MSGYLSDWLEAERHNEAAREHPDCTGKKGCSANKHSLACGEKRRMLYPGLYAHIDAQAEQRARLREATDE